MPTAAKLQWPQGQPLFEVQWRAVAESLAGNGVRSASDLEVTATATDLEIQVASGTAYYLASESTLGAAETHTLSAGDGTYDRWDTVYIDTSTDSSGVREGTPAADPEPPDVQGDELLLAVVYVPQNATDVPDSDVLNWRAQFSNEAEEVHYDDSTGTYSVSSVDAALDELQEAAQITQYPLAPGTDLGVNGYPFLNSDLANSTVDVGAGTGLTTTNVSIGLGGSATLAVDNSAVDLEFVRSGDNAIAGTLATLGVNPQAFGTLVDATVDGNSAAGTAHSYDLALDATTLLSLAVESDGAGGIQNPRVPLAAPLGLLAQSATPGWTGQGAEYYDTGGETPKYADSTGAYQRPDSRVNVDQFDKDETGTVNAGNVGIVWFTSLPVNDTIELYQAGLLLDTLEPAPTDLDLVIYTGDNAGNATKQADVIVGDGTVQDDVTGSPVASHENTTSSAQTVAVGVDNGNFNAGTGAAQDVATTFIGEIV